MESREEAVRLWMEYAADDLEVAETLLAREPPKTRATAFHCQQAVEKYLKGFLVFQGQEPPHTHNLEVLVDLTVQWDDTLHEMYEIVKPLAPFAVDIRYPGAGTTPATEQEARVALRHARQVREAVRTRISL